MTNMDSPVGNRLRAQRLKRRLTLQQVSDATGMHISHLSRLETGNRTPSLRMLTQLAAVYGCQVRTLIPVNRVST